MKPQLMAAAYLLDWLIGDPETMPHPVRWFGRVIAWADRNLRYSEAKHDEFVAGCALAIALPAATAITATAALNQTQRPLLRGGLEVMLAASCLATRNLLDEADRVVSALEAQNLPDARIRLARIVGRDTQTLDASAISRAVIETLAESLSDGVIAPLFYLAVGGVPMALAYKAINTMDSIIGHKDSRYFYFGKAAARLDDAANFIPSRISALLLCAVAAAFPKTSGRNAWETWLADGNKHESPNSGQSESAMAGALSARLGGKNFYDGEAVDAPVIGEKHAQPSISHARAAMKLTAAASVLGCGVALLYLWKRR